MCRFTVDHIVQLLNGFFGEKNYDVNNFKTINDSNQKLNNIFSFCANVYKEKKV